MTKDRITYNSSSSVVEGLESLEFVTLPSIPDSFFAHLKMKERKQLLYKQKYHDCSPVHQSLLKISLTKNPVIDRSINGP